MILHCLNEVSGSETVMLSLWDYQYGIGPFSYHAYQQDRFLPNCMIITVLYFSLQKLIKSGMDKCFGSVGRYVEDNNLKSRLDDIVAVYPTSFGKTWQFYFIFPSLSSRNRSSQLSMTILHHVHKSQNTVAIFVLHFLFCNQIWESCIWLDNFVRDYIWTCNFCSW
jgi:hypothetical protein